LKVDIVVNIQGDEPLISFATIDHLAQALIKDRSVPVATVIKAIEKKEEVDNPNVVKVAVDRKGYALYFSRSTIPYNREQRPWPGIGYFKHLGLYAYRKDFLLSFKKLPFSKLEQTEKLEQLRILEAGYQMKTVLTRHETIGVDTPEDLKRVEALFKRKSVR